MNSTPKLQQRSQDTRNALMRAAEQLIAEEGIENVTARAITTLADQKNESALQYHFGNFKGLIKSIGDQRHEEVELRRQQLLDAQLANSAKPSVRELCKLMIMPAFQLAREDPGFLLYVKGFGRELALSEQPATRHTSRAGDRATVEIRRLMFEALASLDEAILAERFDYAIRFIGLSMSRQARLRNAFGGRSGEVFLNRLADMTAGLLSAPHSPDSGRG